MYHENDGHALNCIDSLTLYYTDNCQKKIKPICVNVRGDFKGPLYSVVTASWKLKIKSKVECPLIFSSTRFYVKAIIQLCYSKFYSLPKGSISEKSVRQHYQDFSARYSATVNITTRRQSLQETEETHVNHAHFILHQASTVLFVRNAHVVISHLVKSFMVVNVTLAIPKMAQMYADK